MANKLDIVERVSYLSSVHKDDDKYGGIRTPEAFDIEGGALRQGGAPRLFSRQYGGLLAQYAAVGLIYGTLPNTVYPFLQKYLNVQGNQTITAATLIDIPWSFKVFYGIVTDCFPIFGFRRRPYMIIGWSLCLLMLIVMASTPVGEPYFMDPQYRKVKPEDYTPEIEATLNRSAQDKGGKYVILMMLAAFGYLMADVAADAVVVELAQREPENVRGTTQTVIYSTRTLFVVIAQVIQAFGFNGKDYGGQFDFSISFPTLMLILAICLAPVVPVTWFFITEERVAQRVPFTGYLSDLWSAIKSRAFYQVIAYKFFSGVFENFTYVAQNPVQDYWAGVTTLNEKISGIIGQAVFGTALVVTGKYGLSWNWRVMPIVTMIAVIALDSICTQLTVWNVFRNQWFWLGVPIVEYVPKGINFIISTYVTVELAGEGNEGAVYGLITTVSNLSDPFARTIAKNIDATMDFSTERIQNDSHEVRRDVTISILIMYAAKLFSLCFLVLLPRQKAETQELKRNGGSSKVMGAITVFYLLFALVWSLTTNILGIFPSTACLKIAGGDGC
ncbi:hypothetical protein P43SY_004990 [Pythium insidiosum]|uniref:Transmembrane protein n=1 Tax=Pythium insidiosum TaxID=114742 RepID=A0AAD5M9Y8_PYTIN|nr:hypothetical protein P43SY_004990 [Pythium insidiosum]KAJ0411892.1 hypothetical protein ATCC90586_005987 [Pythium insidiosum]